MIRGIPPEKMMDQYPVDTHGHMKIGMNSLLVAHDERLVLIDPGCGDFLPKRILDDYGLEMPHKPEELLGQEGYEEDDVTDVIFTHLHFDHGTAAFLRVPGKIKKRYGNARYWMSEAHYRYTMKPHNSERNSFFSFVFRYVNDVHWLEHWDADWMSFRTFNGHTRSMMIPEIAGKKYDLLFASDLLPMRLLINPGSYSYYDVDKELLLKEKKALLDSLDKPALAILYHEPSEPFLFFNKREAQGIKFDDGISMLKNFNFIQTPNPESGTSSKTHTTP
jgi:glyoxylase-like metal-dependent hydrolase (beta-lactamase superfamily II)